MRTINFHATREQSNNAKEMSNYILALLRGNKEYVSGGALIMTEKARQFYTWGARAMCYMVATDGSVGLQFSVSGLKFRGRVRVWYNGSTDYFDVEFLRATREVLVKELQDIDCFSLHNICHQTIERTDDPEV